MDNPRSKPTTSEQVPSNCAPFTLIWDQEPNRDMVKARRRPVAPDEKEPGRMLRAAVFDKLRPAELSRANPHRPRWRPLSTAFRSPSHG